MNEPQFKFMTFRNLEEPPTAVDSKLPPFQFGAYLNSNNLPFQLVTTKVSREEAVDDPDCADLYPEGPLSGPPFVVFYDFITSKAQLDLARSLAGSFRPSEGEGNASDPR